MLKIKNNVELKELEKFGLEFKPNIYKEKESYVVYKQDRFGQYYVKLSINVHTRQVRVSSSTETLNVLYDLISNGLVEKVDE